MFQILRRINLSCQFFDLVRVISNFYFVIQMEQECDFQKPIDGINRNLMGFIHHDSEAGAIPHKRVQDKTMTVVNQGTR